MRLVPWDDAEYEDFAERQVVELASQNINAGEWTQEEAPIKAREALKDLLADRLRVAGHVFLKGILTEGTVIGWMWVAPAPEFLGDDRENKRWPSQITVEESLRKRGYGRALLSALHDRLEAEGVEELWLRVFNWNEAARGLYTSAGYKVVREFPTDAHMCKRFVPEPVEKA